MIHKAKRIQTNKGDVDVALCSKFPYLIYGELKTKWINVTCNECKKKRK